MLNPDKLYETSDTFRALLDETEDHIRAHQYGDESLQRANDGLKAWKNLLAVMKMLEADSIHELDCFHVSMFDLLAWADTLAEDLHNASLKDLSFEISKLEFCETYVEMHRDLLDREVANLGNIRIYLAESYYKKGLVEKADALFRKWLDAEPDWEGGWSGWSGCCLLRKIHENMRDYKKAERILKEGLSVPELSESRLLRERYAEILEQREAATSDHAKETAPDPKTDREGYRKHVAGLIRKMKEGEGMTYRQTAEELTNRGLPTLSGKAVWSDRMVSGIYKKS